MDDSKNKLATINIKITKAQRDWLTKIADQIRDNNENPVPPQDRVFPQHFTEFYTQCGVLQSIQTKQITPNRYSIPKQEITLAQKNEDQKQFEDKLDISINTLYDFYAHKNCFYIQIGNYGFYHLKQDILDLGTPQFNCGMRLRLRAKTIHSEPIYNYGFYAVLKVNSKPAKSSYDIEEKDGRIFPPLTQ